MSVHSLFVSAPRGLVPLLADELRELGARVVRPQPAGCRVRGPLAFAYRICLWSRLANRVLLHLADLRTPDADALYEAVHAMAWSEHAPVDGTLAVDFVGEGAGIHDGRYGAQRIKDAIVDRLRAEAGRRPNVDADAPDVRVHAYCRGSGCSLSIDLAGDSLHRRGWRGGTGAAPLKENVAAALLRLGQLSEGVPVCDPMAGAGTLVVEAAAMLTDRAPGLGRARFGFSGWLGHDATAWDELVAEARERGQAGLSRVAAPIVGTDADPAAIARARDNARRAGLADVVRLEVRPLSAWTHAPADTPGLVVTNPPHGERLGDKHSARELHAELGRTLVRAFPGWRAVVLTTADELRHAIGLPVASAHALDNGPLACVALGFETPARGQAPEHHEDVAPFVNRLRKNLDRLRPWAQREGISCYRLYDADVPPYLFAVDRYEDEVLVQEYAPPARVDAELAAARIDAVLAALPPLLGVPASAIHLARRRRHKGGSQYGRRASTDRRRVVHEGGLQFLVNLDDRIDTGLFLDHRLTRARIRREADGRRVLNLFCYTGTATVYAAAGGARSTTSVDLSRTYLAWAKDNLALNGLDDPRHRLVRADTRAFLADRPGRFDLVFLDPPTWSRSKAMRGDFDVQRDHPELVDAAMACLAPGGVLYFSTNARRFDLDAAIGRRFAVEDLTAATLPRDFPRRPPIHRLWRIVAR